MADHILIYYSLPCPVSSAILLFHYGLSSFSVGSGHSGQMSNRWTMMFTVAESHVVSSTLAQVKSNQDNKKYEQENSKYLGNVNLSEEWIWCARQSSLIATVDDLHLRLRNGFLNLCVWKRVPEAGYSRCALYTFVKFVQWCRIVWGEGEQNERNRL